MCVCLGYADIHSIMQFLFLFFLSAFSFFFLFFLHNGVFHSLWSHYSLSRTFVIINYRQLTWSLFLFHREIFLILRKVFLVLPFGAFKVFFPRLATQLSLAVWDSNVPCNLLSSPHLIPPTSFISLHCFTDSHPATRDKGR